MASTGSLIVDFPIKLPQTRKILYQANNPEKNLPTTETEAVGISRIREILQGRGNQGKSADLIIQAWRQSTKKQYECYLRKRLKFSGSREIDPLQPSINVVVDFYMICINQEFSIVVLGQADLL